MPQQPRNLLIELLRGELSEPAPDLRETAHFVSPAGRDPRSRRLPAQEPRGERVRGLFMVAGERFGGGILIYSLSCKTED